MKKSCLIFLTLFLASQANAVGPEDVLNNLQNAAVTTVKEYQRGGVAALVEGSKGCYQDINKYRFYCIYLDLAARHVSDRDGAGVRFAPEKYFVDEQFLPRAGQIFVRSSMDKNQSNEYLAMVTPLINKFVDNELAKKR
jgi:hypothetical protein